MNGWIKLGILVVALLTVAIVPAPGLGIGVSSPDRAGERDTGPHKSTVTMGGSIGKTNELTRTDVAACGSRSDSYPDTAAGFLTQIDTVGTESLYQEYGELATIRSLAKAKLQVGQFTDEKETEMRLLIDMIRSFQESHQLAQNGSIESSLAAAGRTESCITDLQNQGIEYSSLASIALDRFYERRGQELQQEANQIERTPDRIDRLELAAEAYRRAEASQRFSQTTLRVQRLRTQYRDDIETMNASEQTTVQYLDRCTGCGGPLSAIRTHDLDVFSLYAESMKTQANIDRGQSLASEHGLSERHQRYASMGERVFDTRIALAAASATLIEGYALIVALIAMFVTHRFSAWRETVERSRIGEVVLVEGDLL